MIERGSPFEDRFIPEPNSGCWIWLGATNNKGYGVLSIKKDGSWKVVLATRFSYELHHGPIQPGLCALHKCDTPICINPDHLFLGTKRDNTLDAVRKGRIKFGETNGVARLTSDQVIAIRDELAIGASQAELAAKFQIHQSEISRIASRKRWARI